MEPTVNRQYKDRVFCFYIGYSKENCLRRITPSMAAAIRTRRTPFMEADRELSCKVNTLHPLQNTDRKCSKFLFATQKVENKVENKINLCYNMPESF